jgi:hypothetical protein
MKLYVCYGTWTVGKPVHAHPCGEANQALEQAGHQPEVIRSYGWGLLPGAINDQLPGRRKVKDMTGSYWVPALVTDGGDVIQGSEKIIEWARAHPATSAVAAGASSG